MKYSEAKQGRVFVIRLENNEIVHEVIEQFAKDNLITAASLIILGGADQGSKLIVGPEDGFDSPITPMSHDLDGVHEVTGTGTIFPNSKGEPVLHMHMSMGRQTATVTGCIRRGVKVWQVMEVILYELLETAAQRELDHTTGFELLQP